MNHELSHVSNWLNANKIIFKYVKILFYFVSSSTKTHSKYLGEIMDKHLRWIEHINTIQIQLSKVLEYS